MFAGADQKLPFGNLPRLMLAWISTEAVQTQSRELVLGNSLSEFMRALGIYSNSRQRSTSACGTRCERLFQCHVQLVHEARARKTIRVLTDRRSVESSGGPRADPTSVRCGKARSS